MQAGIDALHRQPVGGKLQEVGLRNLGNVLGRRPIGLVVDDPDRRAVLHQAVDLAGRAAAPARGPAGRGTSATIATSARLSGPNSAANVGSRSTASVSLTIPLRTPAGSFAPALATKASAAAAQAPCGRAGRCSSRPWVSVPRRKRPSAASAVGGRMGGSASAGSGAAPSARPPRPSRAAPAARAPAALAISGSRGAGVPAQAGSGLEAAEAAPFAVLGSGLTVWSLARRLTTRPSMRGHLLQVARRARLRSDCTSSRAAGRSWPSKPAT